MILTLYPTPCVKTTDCVSHSSSSRPRLLVLVVWCVIGSRLELLVLACAVITVINEPMMEVVIEILISNDLYSIVMYSIDLVMPH